MPNQSVARFLSKQPASRRNETQSARRLPHGNSRQRNIRAWTAGRKELSEFKVSGAVVRPTGNLIANLISGGATQSSDNGSAGASPSRLILIDRAVVPARHPATSPDTQTMPTHRRRNAAVGLTQTRDFVSHANGFRRLQVPNSIDLPRRESAITIRSNVSSPTSRPIVNAQSFERVMSLPSTVISVSENELTQEPTPKLLGSRERSFPRTVADGRARLLPSRPTSGTTVEAATNASQPLDDLSITRPRSHASNSQRFSSLSSLSHPLDRPEPRAARERDSRITRSMTNRIQQAIHAGNDDMAGAMTEVIEAIARLHSNRRAEIDRLRDSLDQSEIDRFFNEVV